MIWGGEGEKARRSITQASHVMPPCPKGTCLPWQWEGPENACGVEGWFGPCHGGGEERCCGVLSLAKIWTEELRDSGSPPARHRDPGPQLCSPSLRVSAPGLLQLFTSRIITQEKQFISLREKRGSIHHSIYNTAEMSCQNKHTHTQYCEQKNTGK